MKIKIGNIVILLSVAVTLGLYVMSKQNLSTIWMDPWLSSSQVLSLLGTVFLGTSFVLSSRAKFLENLFGGLDKVTRTHHMVGGISFIMLIHHPLLLAVSVLPNLALAKNYLFLSPIQSYNFGVVALYVMILALIATFVIKLPYNLWLKTHDFLGITLMIGSLHVLTITSDVSRYLPLRMWILGILACGLYAFVYKVFLYRWFGPKYYYLVKKINRLGDILEIYLEPKGEKIPFIPGQFGFVRFDQEGLRETHPFSFSSSPDGNLLRFSVKMLGDYTLDLRNNLKVGVKAEVLGAYGRLYRQFYSDKDVVCIAGGIGVTPFLSMIGFELKHSRDRKIYMFYCAKSEEEASYDDELSTMAKGNKKLKYIPYFSDKNPRLTANDVAKVVGDVKKQNYYICGPTAMMDNISRQLTDLGVNRRNIVMEDFAFK